MRPSSVKEQPKPERGGWGNLRQSTYNQIQATAHLPRACHLDPGVTSHLEGTTQCPVLQRKHSLKAVQASVQRRLAAHSPELSSQLADIKRNVMLDNLGHERHADAIATHKVFCEVAKDRTSCSKKRDSLEAELEAETDAAKQEKLQQQLDEAREKAEAASRRYVETHNRSIEYRSREYIDPEYNDVTELHQWRATLVQQAKESRDIEALASLAFGEGAGPERFTVVASERRPGLVRRLIMRIRQCSYLHAISHLVYTDKRSA